MTARLRPSHSDRIPRSAERRDERKPDVRREDGLRDPTCTARAPARIVTSDTPIRRSVLFEQTDS